MKQDDDLVERPSPACRGLQGAPGALGHGAAEWLNDPAPPVGDCKLDKSLVISQPLPVEWPSPTCRGLQVRRCAEALQRDYEVERPSPASKGLQDLCCRLPEPAGSG